MADELAEVQRLRASDDGAEQDASRDLAPSDGAESSFVGVTAAGDGPYPTQAGVFFAVQPDVVGGDEAEGEAASYAGSGGGSVLALHVGSTAPPVGSRVLVTYVPYSYVFRWG